VGAGPAPAVATEVPPPGRLAVTERPLPGRTHRGLVRIPARQVIAQARPAPSRASVDNCEARRLGAC
jgi:hypothetical protein